MAADKLILGVQYLRGIAALGVLLCHYGSAINIPWLASIFSYGQLGVFIFFFISGFIIVYSLTKANYQPKQFGRFLIKRSIRIDPAYFATIVLTLLLFKILSVIPSFRGSSIPFIPGKFLAHIVYVVPFTNYGFYNHVFWTLCVEFQFYLFVGILYFAINHRIYRALLLLAFCATCFINFNISYYLVFTYAPIFCFGISLVDVLAGQNRYRLLLPVVFIGVIAFKFTLFALIVLLLSALIILYFKKFNKPLFWLGQISYSLYLTHSLVLIIITGVLKRLGVNLLQHQILWLIFGVTTALLVAGLFYHLIENPSMKLSQKIFYKRFNRNAPKANDFKPIEDISPR